MTTAAGARRRTLKDGGAANPPELPEMESIIGYKLRRSQLYVFHDFIQSFAKLKLRPAEFSEALGIKRANFVALMDGLEARGLASRRKGDIDKRSHALHLTPEGERFLSRMMAVWTEHENRLIAKLGGIEERDRLIALLDRLVRD